MSVGDVISGLEYGSGYKYLTPSSGDEWMITAIGSNSTSTDLSITADDGNDWRDMYNSFAGVGDDEVDNQVMMSDNDTLHWFITNTSRIRSYSGSSAAVWWMGIKSKE